MISAETLGNALALHQLLVGFLPRRWQSVTIEVQRDDDGDFVHLTNLRTQVFAGGGQSAPFLGLDQADSIQAMNEALAEIASELDDLWRGPAARFDRTPDGAASLVLLGADGGEQSSLKFSADAVAEQILSDELFDALDATRSQAHERQTAFQSQLQGFQRWGYTQDRALLELVLADGRPWSMPGQLLGSWSREAQTWMWAWANPSVPPVASAAASKVRDGVRGAKGMAALTTGSFACREAMAVELALHVAAAVGARGVFPADYGAGIAYVAAFE